MDQRPLGKTSIMIPVIGQGTWNLEGDDRADAVRALRRGLDLGMTHVDTAEMYGSGEVERIVGEAIEGRRDEVFLASKVLPSHASRGGTIRACDASLRRLRTDRLDLYLLHWPGSEPLEATIAAFEELVRTGKVRAWGLSNFDDEELDHALAIAGEGRIACNQVLYHLEQRSIEHRVVPWCERHGVTVVAYSPFGSGSMPRATGAGGRVLAEIAAAHGASPHQVALAFLARRPSVVTIPKAGRIAHVEDNARAAELRLGGTDVERLDQAFPLGRARRGVPTL